MVAFLDGDDIWPADKPLRQAGQTETIPDALYREEMVRVMHASMRRKQSRGTG